MLNLTLPAEAGLITPQPGEVLMVTNADLRGANLELTTFANANTTGCIGCP